MFQSKPRADFSPPSEGTVYRLVGDRAVREQLCFGIEPAGLDGRPQRNVRAEGCRFPVEQCCLVPASEFYIPGRYRPATRRGRFTLADANQLFCFAGIWRPATSNWPASYATITVDAGSDAAPFGERQMAVLLQPDWADWLSGARPEEELLVPPPAGTFAVEEIGRPTPALADLFG